MQEGRRVVAPADDARHVGSGINRVKHRLVDVGLGLQIQLGRSGVIGLIEIGPIQAATLAVINAAGFDAGSRRIGQREVYGLAQE